MRRSIITVCTLVASVAAAAPVAAAIGDPQLSVADAQATETTVCSDAIPYSTLIFTVSLSEPTDHDVQITFGVVLGSADGDDVSGASTGEAVIPEGETEIDLDVLIEPDEEREPDESLQLRVTNASGADIADGEGLGTIHDDDDPELERHFGLTRIETAIALSDAAVEDPGAFGPPRSPSTLVVARWDDPADALAAAPFTRSLDGRLVLTPTGDLHDEVAELVEDDGTEQAILIGGTDALNEDVEAELEALGVEVERLNGTDRAVHYGSHVNQISAVPKMGRFTRCIEKGMSRWQGCSSRVVNDQAQPTRRWTTELC